MFPRITFCHSDGRGYNYSRIGQLGYKDAKAFLIGRNVHGNGWMVNDKTPEEVFETVYSEPKLEEVLRSDSWLKLKGSLYASLDWRVRHMNYGVGRCLELNLTRTNYSETTIILKFNSFENFTEGVKVDLTITGEYKMVSYYLILSIQTTFFLFKQTSKENTTDRTF